MTLPQTAILSATDAAIGSDLLIANRCDEDQSDLTKSLIRLESLPRQTADRWPWDVEFREDSKSLV